MKAKPKQKTRVERNAQGEEVIVFEVRKVKQQIKVSEVEKLIKRKRDANL